MATQTKIGHGSKLEIFDVGSPGWFEFAEIVSISGPSMTRDAVDATHSQSPGGWREFIPGLKDGGECTCEMNFVPANVTTAEILATFNSDSLISCRVSFPDSPATVWTFDAFITAFEPETPLEDKMAATVSFKISGKPGFVP